MQKQKMTLTLPIGAPQKLNSNEIRVGKPGSTPVTGPTKLKLPSGKLHLVEVPLIVQKFQTTVAFPKCKGF